MQRRAQWRDGHERDAGDANQATLDLLGEEAL
jgi:hypothetical protein